MAQDDEKNMKRRKWRLRNGDWRKSKNRFRLSFASLVFKEFFLLNEFTHTWRWLNSLFTQKFKKIIFRKIFFLFLIDTGFINCCLVVVSSSWISNSSTDVKCATLWFGLWLASRRLSAIKTIRTTSEGIAKADKTHFFNVSAWWSDKFRCGKHFVSKSYWLCSLSKRLIFLFSTNFFFFGFSPPAPRLLSFVFTLMHSRCNHQLHIKTTQNYQRHHQKTLHTGMTCYNDCSCLIMRHKKMSRK